jgi:hypothetical protein
MQNATLEIMENLALNGSPNIPIESDPMPEDRDFNAVVEDAINLLFEGFADTPLDRYSQSLAWGLVNSFHMVRTKLEREMDYVQVQARELENEQDGSEVMSTELESKTAKAFAMQDHISEFEELIDTLSSAYGDHTGTNWAPRSGTRAKGRKVTSAVIDSKQARRARARLEDAKLNPKGYTVGFAGSANYQDYDNIFATLDKALAKYPDMILHNCGQQKGAELIASKWADARGVTEKVFKPNFDLGKAAPFKRNDRMLDEGLDALIVYPGNGIIANMQDKAIAAGVTVWVRETK